MALLNRKAVKQKALQYATLRNHKFTRVSKEFVVDLEHKLDMIILDSVKNHPTKGKTLSQIR